MNAEQARTALARALAQVAPEVDLSTVDADADLREQLDLDSMDFLNLVTALDDQAGVRISEDDYPALSSLSGAVQFLQAAQQ